MAVPVCAGHRLGDLRQAAVGFAVPGEATFQDHHAGDERPGNKLSTHRVDPKPSFCLVQKSRYSRYLHHPNHAETEKALPNNGLNLSQNSLLTSASQKVRVRLSLDRLARRFIVTSAPRAPLIFRTFEYGALVSAPT